MFYGLCFTSSIGGTVAQYVGFAGDNHYAGFLEGRVVDMFEMPFTFVWNIADAAITIGVIMLLLLYRKDLGKISLKSE
jgi:signal peptidase II